MIEQFAGRIVDAPRERIRAEPAEDDGVNRPDARAGQHGDRRFRHHRHVDGNPVALLDAEGFQDVGELARFAVQLLVA